MRDQATSIASPTDNKGSISLLGPVSGVDEHFKSTSHAESALKTMRSFYASGKLCDVTLIAGGRKIKAHRLILSAASDYFSAMFTSDVLEAAQEEIELKDIDSDALLALIDYCYTGCLELNEDTVEVILATAQHLLLTEVVVFCCEYLIKQLHPSNCLGIQAFADVQGCTGLNKIAMNFTVEHFPDVIQSQEFFSLPSEQLSILLSSDDLNVPSEETVYNSLIMWLKHDFPNRKQDAAKLLALIRLPLVTPQFLADRIETDTLFQGNYECLELINEAWKYHSLPERRRNMQTPRTRPRKSTVGHLYVVAGDITKTSPNTINKYDLRSDTWSVVTSLACRRLQVGVATMGGKIYVVGGRESLKTLNTFESYDPKTNTWTPLPAMGTHRHGLGVGVLGGPLYAVGGHDGWSYLSSVERWDPHTRQWNYVAQMNCSRSTAGVAVLNGKLYAVGGRDGSSCHDSVECYDPHTDKWSFCAPMAQRRGGVGLVAANGFLYAVGGHDAPASNPCSCRFDSVERYDPSTDTWTQIASLLMACDSPGVCFLGNKLHCVGGSDGRTYLNMVQIYDPQTNEWTQGTSLPEGRAGSGVVMLPTLEPAK